MSALRLRPSEVYAVPGQRHIIDMINPETGLSIYGAKTADAIAAEYPGAVRMTFEAWQAAVSVLQRTPITWEPTTREKFWEMLEVLPPAFWRGGLFLVGEPDDHDVMSGAPRFQAYRQIRPEGHEGAYQHASRAITVAEARAILAERFAGAGAAIDPEGAPS